MATVNLVIIVGYLGQDPEIRYTQNGKAVANLSVATTETWKDKGSGEKHEKTEWHRVILWGRQAEVAGEYLKKGSQVFIRGRNETRKWQDKDGKDRYTTEVQASEMKMMGRKGDGPSGQSKPAPDPKQTADLADDWDDDIPF